MELLPAMLGKTVEMEEYTEDGGRRVYIHRGPVAQECAMTIGRIKLSVEMEFLQWRRGLAVLLGNVGVVAMVAWARTSGAIPNQASEKKEDRL